MKFVIADPKTGKCYQIEQEDNKSRPFYGVKLGSEVDGSLVGLTGCKLVITGGTDKQGFPMRADVHGTERRKILLSSGPGFRKSGKEDRRRKTVRGNIISDQNAQINFKVISQGAKSVAEILGKPEKKEEKTEKKENKEKTEEKKAKKETAKEEETNIEEK